MCQATGKEVLSAYGRFYGLLLTAGYDNFQDYILDQVGRTSRGQSARVEAEAVAEALERGARAARCHGHFLVCPCGGVPAECD